VREVREALREFSRSTQRDVITQERRGVLRPTIFLVGFLPCTTPDCAIKNADKSDKKTAVMPGEFEFTRYVDDNHPCATSRRARIGLGPAGA
jgi:hypothetical protein